MSANHNRANWARHAKTARKRIAAQLPLPCLHCPGMVTPEDLWDVAHIVDLAHGGDAFTYTAAHRYCNRSDGGRQGAKKTNQARKNLRKW